MSRVKEKEKKRRRRREGEEDRRALHCMVGFA